MRLWCWLIGGHKWNEVISFDKGFESPMTLLQCSCCRLVYVYQEDAPKT